MKPPNTDVSRAVFYIFVLVALILAGIFGYGLQIGPRGLLFGPAEVFARR